jgi:hypothetical protein
MFLMVEFPRIVEDGVDFSVVYYEKVPDYILTLFWQYRAMSMPPPNLRTGVL